MWDCELIMDVLTNRNSLPEDSTQRLILKRRLCTPITESDPDLANFTYAQASFDILAGRLAVDRGVSTQLAGLMLQIDLGDFKESELISLEEVLSESAMFMLSYREWSQALRTEHRKLLGMPKNTCKFAYIQLVSRSNLFASEHFPVNLLEIKGTARLSLPKALWLSINFQGFFLISRDFETTYHVFSYQDVISWGVASDRFVLVTLFFSDQIEIHLETKLGPVLQSISEDYANLISGRGSSSPTLPAKWLRREGLARTFVTPFPRLSKALFK